MLPNRWRHRCRLVSPRMPSDRSTVRGSGSGPGVSLISMNSDSHTNNLVPVPSSDHLSRGLALVEELLESIVDSIASGTELTIPYRVKRSSPATEPLVSSQAAGGQHGVIRFPGRTPQDVRRFGACLEETELSHLVFNVLRCLGPRSRVSHFGIVPRSTPDGDSDHEEVCLAISIL